INATLEHIVPLADPKKQMVLATFINERFQGSSMSDIGVRHLLSPIKVALKEAQDSDAQKLGLTEDEFYKLLCRNPTSLEDHGSGLWYRTYLKILTEYRVRPKI